LKSGSIGKRSQKIKQNKSTPTFQAANDRPSSWLRTRISSVQRFFFLYILHGVYATHCNHTRNTNCFRL